jgi:hypothetical protein
MPKPSLDSTLNWLEGRFTKLITGDGESSPPTEDASQVEQQKFGPFSHYSTISSTTTSESPSPQLSTINLNVLPPLPRGSPPAHILHVPIDRASSAMEHLRRKQSPGPRVASASASTHTFAQSASFGQAVNGYSHASTWHSNHGPNDTVTPGTSSNPEGQEMSWWGSTYVAESVSTPTAATFVRIDNASIPSSSEGGFISLMDASEIPQTSFKNHSSSREEEDEADLGIGNTSMDKAKPSNVDGNQPALSAEKMEPAKLEPPGEYSIRTPRQSMTSPI